MGKTDSLKYRAPGDWFAYDAAALIGKVAEAQASVQALTSAPFRRSWLEDTQTSQLRAEVDGTCGLAGLDSEQAPRAPGLDTHPATTAAYHWLGGLVEPITLGLPLICEVQGRLLAGDGIPYQQPGRLRGKGEQIFFGTPRQKGAKGGKGCLESIESLVSALNRDPRQPLIIKGLALHYHILSIRPFHEANGRTARALETIFRQAAGLKGPHFVSMSRYYLSERRAYQEARSASRIAGHDLTPFLDFALSGLILECRRLFRDVRDQLAKAVFENTMVVLFDRLKTGKRQAMAARQVCVLRAVLGSPGTSHQQLYDQLRTAYAPLKNPWKAFLRDLHDLIEIGAIAIRGEDDNAVHPRLDWPSSITEELFFQHYRDAPRSGVALPTAV